MTDVTLIQKLRTATGAGIMECKKALEEVNFDLDKAIEELRKRGAVKAAKVADREAKEGVIRLAITADNKKGHILKVRCETDFVAKNSDFIAAVDKMAQDGLDVDATEVFNKIKDELILKIGENLVLEKTEVAEGEFVAGYIHSNNKIGCLVVFSAALDVTLAKDIAMHIVASSPSYISEQEVPGEVLAKEKDIYREQLKGEGKPAEIIEKIIDGKLKKFYEEACLLNQKFIKDEEKTIKAVLGAVSVNKFILYSF